MSTSAAPVGIYLLCSFDLKSAPMLSQQILPDAMVILKKDSIAATNVWIANRPSSSPRYDPAFGDRSKNEP